MDVKDGNMSLIVNYLDRFDNSPNIKAYNLLLNEHNLYF
jgi:hypothetical protein